MSQPARLKSPVRQVVNLHRELEAAHRRIRDLEHHLGAAINHIANEHRPPADLLAVTRTLLEKK
ncbi:hypothetical protein ACSYDW_07215 [Paeniglutamicibacter sp. R2-26]|uniref:hypothetical protein n=1 Tax=Paeniglutamicibacter sp. R2-26 TaxID=3144417 RepID=UPI003EE53154